MEQALADLLLRMSYMHGLGPGLGPRGYGNILIQPDLLYEELLERYGLGNENRRGASQEIIDSYPILVVGQDEALKQCILKGNEEESTKPPSESDLMALSSCLCCCTTKQGKQWIVDAWNKQE
jgi:hypothetical protein